MYWFPTLTVSATTPGALTPYGMYTTNVVVDGSALWETPSDGASLHDLRFFTSDATILNGGGSNPAAAGNASLMTPAPEPSALMFVVLGFAFCWMQRRRGEM